MNNKGQGIVLFLACLPVLLTLGFFSFQLFHCLHIQVSTHHVCRRKLAKTQQDLGQKLENLLAMNTAAYALQKAETMAKFALKIAKISLNIEAIEFASKALDLVHSQQDAFHYAQKAILMQARLLSAQSMMSIRTSAEFLHSSVNSQKMTSLGLAVEPYPENSRSPRYRPVNNFKEQQSLALSWSTQMIDVVPRAIKQNLHIDPKIKGQCSATLIKERSKWNPQLNRVNPLWR